ncbi:MAG TPA: hypothetical protein VFB79_07685 [Candidatus Angelobacter sp.]|nr:hypothetical protein [Candidatus Angelobacter sp.]
MSFTGFSFGSGFPDSFGTGSPISLSNLGFGDPGIGGSSSTVFVGGSGGVQSSGSSAQSWLSTLLPWATLGSQTFLADQAITSPRASTVTVLPNGQLVATGGGAATPSTGAALALGSIPSWIWIVLVLVLFISVLKR